MRMKKVLSMTISALMLLSSVPCVTMGAEESILHYDFNSEIEQGTRYGAVIEHGYAYFDGVDDYIHMPDNLVSGQEDVTFVINVKPEMDGANQFTFTVGTSENNYLFLNTNNGSNARFAMTNVGWWQEEAELKGDRVEKSAWASIAIVMQGKTKKMYIDGSIVSETTSELLASSLGDTNQNYLAKSQYANDNYFKGYIEDFAIYPEALDAEEISAIAKEHEEASKKAEVWIAAEELEFETNKLTENIELPDEYRGMKVTWTSDNEEVLSSKGEIKRGEMDVYVVLTAVFSDGEGNTAEREYGFMVIHEYKDREKAEMDAENIRLVGNLLHLKEDLYLPLKGEMGSDIVWYSSDESVITHKGEIKRAKSGEGAKSATLTAITNYKGTASSKEFEIVVEEEDFAYLFAYFTGNAPEQERLFYGLSRDGYHFFTINGGNSVLESTKGHKCMRDPFIMQGQNGKYYALFTDMRSWDGWASQSSIIIFESDDLINWDEGTIIDFNQFGWYNRAWAPQAIWDPEFYDEETGEYGAYMIYLALCSGGNTQMYKVYSKDMKTLITEPELLYRHAEFKDDIDSDIIYKDGMYYMYVKDESDGGVYVVTSKYAGGPYSDRINALPAKKNGNNVAIEGSAIFKLMNEDKYHLVYDAYMDGFFVMTETEDLVTFNQLDRREYSFNFTPRHGYVITLSKAEVDALEEAYGNVVPDERAYKKDPILYYDFEDAADKSGNFFDAQLSSSAAFAQGVSGGRGLLLDGTSESYVTIPSEALDEVEDYTVSAWIKTDNRNNTQRVFDFGIDTNKYFFLTPYYADGVARGAITQESYTNELGISVEKVVDCGTWTHMVLSQEGNVMRMYIDGILVGEADNVTLNPWEVSMHMEACYIGKSMWPNDRYFDGMIDEFRVYDRALSEEEVTALYTLNAPTDSYAAITDGEIVYNYKAKGEACTAVIAQYDDEGALLTATRFNLEKDKDARVEVAKTGNSYKVLCLESITSLKPVE